MNNSLPYQEEEWFGFKLFQGQQPVHLRAKLNKNESTEAEKMHLDMLQDLRTIYQIEIDRRSHGKKQLPKGIITGFAQKYGRPRSVAFYIYNKFKQTGNINDTRGRPAIERLTLEQQKELIGLFLSKTYYIHLSDGYSQKGAKDVADVSVLYVWSAMIQTYPPLAQQSWFTPRYIANYLQKLEEEEAALFTQARKGDKSILKFFLAQLPNTGATFPFERVQSDGRYLPMYIQYKDMTCTVILLIFIDDFSGYIPCWRLLPRKERNGMEKPYKIDFKASDVRLLFVELLRITNFIPKFIYTDNGSQFIALERVVHYLGDGDQSHALTVIHSQPGKPQGRGIVEDALKRIGAKLAKYGGYVTNEKDITSWQQARNHPDLLSIEDLRKEVSEVINALNKTPHEGKTQSPYELWAHATGPRYAAPSPNHFAHLLPSESVTEGLQTLSNRGVQYNKGSKTSRALYYVPKNNDEATALRWLQAIRQPQTTQHKKEQKVRFQVHNMQEFGTFYYAFINGCWEAMVESKNHGRSLQQRMRNQHFVVQHNKMRLRGIQTETMKRQREHHGVLPQYDPIKEEAVYEKPNIKRPEGTKKVPPKPTTIVANALSSMPSAIPDQQSDAEVHMNEGDQVNNDTEQHHAERYRAMFEQFRREKLSE